MENKIATTGFDHSDDTFMSLQEAIENIIKEEGYTKYKVEKKIIPQAGNFLSFLYEVDITGETAGGEKVTSLFIKKSVTLDKITLADIAELYSREVFIYNDLSNMCLSLQEAHKVPEEERFTFIKSYDSDEGTVIMENLAKKGFKTYDKTQSISLKFAELSIIQLAKFHALSYVIKERCPKYFEDKIKVLRSPYNLNRDFKGFTHNICVAAGQVVKEEDKNKIIDYAPRMIQIYCKYIKDSVPSNGCLCHGDYKILNIMVKEMNGEATEAKPIDYQLTYYSSPVNDFLFFIFSGTNRDFRRKHLSYLKDLYFKNFAKFLSYFNVDVNVAYSQQEFEKDYEERLELGLAYGLILAVFTFANTEEGFDVSKLSLSELPIVTDEMFADRVKEIVEDYIEWGYL